MKVTTIGAAFTAGGGVGLACATTNQQFLNAIFRSIQDDEYLWLACFHGYPKDQQESARKFSGKSHKIEGASEWLDVTANNYFVISSIRTYEGNRARRQENFARCHVIGLDDVGTKAALPPSIKPSYQIETSPGNSQVGLILATPIGDLKKLKIFYKELSRQGITDPGAGGPQNRYMRLPNGTNQKPAYGGNFQCKLLHWEPDLTYEFEALADELKIKLTDSVSVPVKKPPQPTCVAQPASEVQAVDSTLDSAIIKKLLSNHRIHDLWLGHDTGKVKDSEADYAFVCDIARETRDPVQIERIYLQSPRVERVSHDGVQHWKSRPDTRKRDIENALKDTEAGAAVDVGESSAFVDAVLSEGEASRDPRQLYSAQFLAHMLVLRNESAGDFDYFRRRIGKVATLGVFDDALKKADSGAGAGLNQSEATQAVIDLMGGMESLIHTKSGFWTWRQDLGHWQRLELDELVRQRVQAVIPPRLLTASVESSVFRLLKTKVTKDVCFDRPPNEYAINVMNGTLHWSGEAWELKPHQREDFLTACLPVQFDSEAPAPAFAKFLSDIFEGDPDAAEKQVAVLTMIGYTLTPSTRFERFVMLQGKLSSNGKSTLLSVLEALVGKKNVSSISPSNLADRFQKAELHQKLANIVAELPREQILPDDMVKAIVSGDAVTAENKGRDPFSFRPYATLWYGTNFMPFTRDYSRALFDRAIVLTMNRVFDRTDTGRTGTAIAVRGLAEQLKTELPGILNMALAAFAECLKSGKGISEPPSSIEAKRLWRRDIDPVALFADDCLYLPSPGTDDWHQINLKDDWPTSASVFRAFQRWCEATGTSVRLTQNWLTQRLEALFPSVKAGRTSVARTITGCTLDPCKAYETVGAAIE